LQESQLGRAAAGKADLRAGEFFGHPRACVTRAALLESKCRQEIVQLFVIRFDVAEQLLEKCAKRRAFMPAHRMLDQFERADPAGVMILQVNLELLFRVIVAHFFVIALPARSGCLACTKETKALAIAMNDAALPACKLEPRPALSPTRAIIHLDMDCFYAAIEVRDRPELRGKPVGVGGARDRRGVLTTCNYEARKFGVRSAMPTFMALQRCPKLIVLPPRFDVYRRESAIIRAILHRFTPLVEPLSLDEAYLDVSAHPGAPGALAEVIRNLIFRKTKLTASAGVAPNKLVAKIASDLHKPNGQCEVGPNDVPEFMAELPVRRIWGIGAVTEEKLQQRGITTCGELQRFSRLQLLNTFGKFGAELYDLCRGIDERPVEPHRERKSLSNEETFSTNLDTLAACEEKLEELFAELMADLAQKETTRTVTKIFVKLKFADFTRTTVERAGLAPSLGEYRTLLAEAFARTGKSVRLMGVGVRFASFELPDAAQLPLL
jgi:DNA polymerase IV